MIRALSRIGVTTAIAATFGCASSSVPATSAANGNVIPGVEVLLRDFSIRTFLPIVLASVIATPAGQASHQRT